MRQQFFALACIAALTFQTLQAAEMNIDSVPSITVSGQGETSARPDAVFITLGVETRGKDAATALTENNTAMQRLFDSLDRNGIEKKNIQTSNFNINPLYENSDRRGNSGQAKIIGYQVSNRVRIKSTKIEELGSLLDSLVREGANTMYGIEFGISDPKAAEDKALKAAVQDAKRQAELLAEAAGVKLGKALKIVQSSGYSPMRYAQPRMMAMAESSVPIAEGEQQVTASITITYELKSE